MVNNIKIFGDVLSKELKLGPREKAHIQVALPHLGVVDVYVSRPELWRGLEKPGFYITVRWKDRRFVAEQHFDETEPMIGMSIGRVGMEQGARVILGEQLQVFWVNLADKIMDKVKKHDYARV